MCNGKGVEGLLEHYKYLVLDNAEKDNYINELEDDIFDLRNKLKMGMIQHYMLNILDKLVK